ncbi:hypothetical conserved protein [Oceanobacillus iheyensis HTE831]|uniref:Hypothetical conserved protein n=1 Tax=Oceanobacillus iheyensis (strain DSM 14371 / CIP 107618 / JCM 11309 / KCTC 3954 / HTE831) TaxID=221109 RepID=Q8ERF2_OCEIH|nr:hypothetical conserved protein [Oceanobacillus iheyensis HTE831]
MLSLIVFILPYICYVLGFRKSENSCTAKFHDYDRKKCKRMRHVFYKKQSKLTKKQQWYLDCYLHMSPDLKRAHELK